MRDSESCWKCKKPLAEDVIVDGRMPFKATCDHCMAYLHSCLGCRYYKVGLPNNCQVPGTEYVPDRERFNYCEEFKILKRGISPQNPSKDDIEKRLFGN